MPSSPDTQTKSRRFLEGVGASTPLAEAARIAVGFRLEAALKRMRAIGDATEADRVRRLRVAIRRASVALRAFEPALPAKTTRRLRRRLNRIRRRAGRVRDCDVHLALIASLASDGSAVDAAALAHVRDALTRAREKRRHRLVELIKRKSSRIERAAGRILASLASDEAPQRAARRMQEPSPTLADLARPVLAGLIAEVQGAAGADIADPTSVHELRIACRRLRYAIELFASALPGAARTDCYPRLIEIQDQIGAAGDVCTFQERLEGLTRKARATCANDDLPRRLDTLTRHCRALYEARIREASTFLEVSALDDLREIGKLLDKSVRPPPRSPNRT